MLELILRHCVTRLTTLPQALVGTLRVLDDVLQKSRFRATLTNGTDVSVMIDRG